MKPNNTDIKISELGEENTFVSGTKNWRIDYADFEGNRFEKGVRVSWGDPDTGKRYRGVIEWLIIYDGKVDVSIDNPHLGRLNLEELEYLGKVKNKLK